MAHKNSTLLNTLSTADLKRLLAARERIDVLEKEQSTLQKALTKVEAELDKLMADSEVGSAAPAVRKPGRKKTAAKKKATKKKIAKKRITKTKITKTKAIKKTTKKKTTKKKAAVRRKTATKKTSSKKVARKAVKKVRKKPTKTSVKKATRKAAGKTGGRVKLEDVIVAVIRKRGGPVSYKDLFAAIVKGKLFTSKSGNFDNVMRRTLSTSDMVKRVGRGIYDIA